MQLNLSNIEYAYPAAVEPALSGVTATFPKGWTGIVGDNGGGKTTLCLVACGLLQPDAGAVAPPLVSLYCAQDASVPPANLEDFAFAYDSAAVRLRRDLAIGDDWAHRYSTLSGGQQKRLQVACALWAVPDVLAVDEPTNHVDAATRRSISAALSRFGGIGLLVSHDRELLDELCSQCLFVADGAATMRPGGYSQASSQAAGVGKRDSDARDRRNLAIVTGKDGQAGRLSSRMEGRLQSADARLSALRVEKRYDADVWLDAAPSRRKVIYRADPVDLPLGEVMLRVPMLHIGNTDHIGLVGDNGTGKTTLVKAIVTGLPDSTRALYIPQEPDEQQRRAALAALRGLSDVRRGRVLSTIAQLNSDPDRVLEGDEVSPGEMRKLMLALGILESPELVVVDEPTNHLDLGSTEALERLLSAYPGALLLVSHDAALVQAATGIIWRIRKEEGCYSVTIG